MSMQHTTTIGSAMQAPIPPAVVAQRRERRFFGGMALLLLVTVFAGFAPTYYLNGAFGTPFRLSPLLHVHGVAFTAWMLLLVTQTLLIRAGRADLHRRFGMAGLGLAVLLVVLGMLVPIARTRDGLIADHGAPPLVFLAVPVFGILAFAVLVGAAVYWRRRSAVHKRLMTIATLELVTAAVSRLPVISSGGPIAFFAATDVFILVIAAYDLLTLRRIHPATLWGGLLLIASQPLRLLIGASEPWIAFATWLTR